MGYAVASLIPAYHLAPKEIDEIVKRLSPAYETPLVVYNDEDKNLRDYLNFQHNCGQLRVIYIPFQIGKAEAVRRGLQSLISTSKADIVVQIDGRLKQPPDEVAQIVEYLIDSKAHMVVANRYHLQNLEGQVHRATASGLFSAIVKQLTRYNLQDVACGTRAYVRNLAARFLATRSFGYGLEVEEILIASTLGLAVEQWPIHSNHQDNATNAEKVEDNLLAFLSYANETKMSDTFRATLCHMLANIKKRNSFDIDTSALGYQGVIHFEYVGGSAIAVNAYTSGTASDGYSVSPIS
jgi:hypothetical protein